MGRIETALKEEIGRIAKKQTRQMLEKHVGDIRRLKKRVAELQAEVDGLKAAGAKAAAKAKVAAAARSAGDDTQSRVRLSPGLIKKLRKRLNISQPNLALLVDVTPAAVGFWETGKSNPRPDKKAKLVALRSLGRRDVKRLLAEKKSS